MAMGIFPSVLTMEKRQRAWEFSNIFLCWGKVNQLLEIPNVIGSDLDQEKSFTTENVPRKLEKTCKAVDVKWYQG